MAKGAARARRAVEKVVDGKPEMIGTDKDFRFVRTLFINVLKKKKHRRPTRMKME